MSAVKMEKVSKIFGSFYANKEIDLTIEKGEVHAILGENGAGKSTLMNILFGLYHPDEGSIYINDQKVDIKDPLKANELGIGMVHQHFKLIPPFTVTDNIILGSEPTKLGGVVDRKVATEKVAQIIKEYDFTIDPKSKVKDLSVGKQQQVEILKMLYKNSEILIFDEPTGALTPQEIQGLMSIIKGLKAQGKSIILITHKLEEIKAIADRCTVIRSGEVIGTVNVSEVDEAKMAEMMVGRAVSFEVDIPQKEPGRTVLKVDNVQFKDSRGTQRLKGVSFEVKAGEILGFAGVDGNGQNEIVDTIVGLEQPNSGEITYYKDDKEYSLNKLAIRKRNDLGITYVPQDRHKYGLVLDYTVTENSVLLQYHQEPFSKNGLINHSEMEKKSEEIIEKYNVKTPHGGISMARALSGGNQQKLIIGREIERDGDVLIAFQPTRGVDVGAIENIHSQIIEQRSKDKAVMLVSLELDEVMKLSDRIAVVFDGRIIDIVDAKKYTKEEIGLMMAGKAVEGKDEK